jgi:phosphopantothenoylcysteine decarboxylase/phosphopantothenate--cysteine ligase
MLADKKILLIISGGIAAYKALDLIRRLKERQVRVVPVLTRAAEEFVTPLTVSALAGEKVYRDLFDLTDEAEMGHIELSRAADLVVVAPCDGRSDGEDGGWARERPGLDLADGDRQARADRARDEREDVGASGDPEKPRNVLQGDGFRVVGPEVGSRWPAANSDRAVCPKCRRSSPPSRRLSGPGRFRASCARDLGADP